MSSMEPLKIWNISLDNQNIMHICIILPLLKQRGERQLIVWCWSTCTWAIDLLIGQSQDHTKGFCHI